MHHLQLIAVEIDPGGTDPDEAACTVTPQDVPDEGGTGEAAVTVTPQDMAVAAVEDFLAQFQDDVWDWYEVGGRWSGSLGGADVLCAADDPGAFLAAVDRMVDTRRAHILELTQYLAGPRHDAPLPELGGVAVQVPGETERLHAMYRESASEFAELVSTARPDQERFEMLGYRMTKLGRLVAGYYCTDSGFFDAAYGIAGTEELRRRVLDAPANQFLVVVDLHN